MKVINIEKGPRTNLWAELYVKLGCNLMVPLSNVAEF